MLPVSSGTAGRETRAGVFIVVEKDKKPFDKVRIGTRVIISPSDAEPVEFSHPALFVPKCYRGPPERRISVDLPSSWISAAVA